jgi:hypothetical protein
MKGGFILNIVIREESVVVQLLASVDEPDIRCGNPFSISVCIGNTANGGTCISLNCHRLARKCLDKNLNIFGYNLDSIGSMDLWCLAVVIPEAYILRFTL